MKKKWRNQNPLPRSRLGLTGPESDGGGGMPVLEESELQGLLILVLSQTLFLPHLFLYFSSLCPLPLVPFKLPNLSLLCFRGCTAMPGQLPVTRSGMPGGQRSSEDRICSSWVEGQKPLQHLAGGKDSAGALQVLWPTLD